MIELRFPCMAERRNRNRGTSPCDPSNFRLRNVLTQISLNRRSGQICNRETFRAVRVSEGEWSGIRDLGRIVPQIISIPGNDSVCVVARKTYFLCEEIPLFRGLLV